MPDITIRIQAYRTKRVCPLCDQPLATAARVALDTCYGDVHQGCFQTAQEQETDRA